MSSRRSKLLKFFAESFMIMVSVLFALFLNQWSNEHNQAERTEKLLENLKEEITLNYLVLKKVIPYHQKFAEGIAVAYDSNRLEETFYDSYFFYTRQVAPKGIIQDHLHNIAWTVAKQDGISNRISWEKTKALSRLYDQQETVNETLARIITLISSREAQRKELLKETVLVLEDEVLELIGQEQDLYRYYKSTFALLKEKE